ncbi:MAG: TetR/AcrR family transcriptional regulator [Acidimicrobiales bacterium]
MTAAPTASGRTDGPLTKERVLRGGLALADRIGIEPFTIRRLAAELGVKPMTIYHHVAGKEAIIDGMVDLVFAEIDLPPTDLDWRSAMQHRCRSARAVLRHHPWAPPLMESRTTPSPHTLRHHEAVLACFREAGFSLALTAHAYAIVDSYVYGFALQEAHLPFHGGEAIGDLAEAIVAPLPADEYPRLIELTRDHVLQPGYDFGDSFELGLDLLLDGLAAAASAAPA